MIAGCLFRVDFRQLESNLVIVLKIIIVVRDDSVDNAGVDRAKGGEWGWTLP